MSYYLSSLIITYLFVIVSAICVIWHILERYRKAELLREERAEARAAEERKFDLQMRQAIERERIMHEPVTAVIIAKKEKPIRKATGYFSDEAAQKVVKC